MAMTIFALSILAAGFAVMLLTLQHRVPKLKAKEQAFRFHALRDQLQLLAVEGRISTTSVGYEGLMRMSRIDEARRHATDSRKRQGYDRRHTHV